MSCTQDEMKKAVECGYWHLYRYDPRRIAEGKNPFQLDSPAPDTDKLMDFLMGENRFASLKNNFPERADALYQKEIADDKYYYVRSCIRQNFFPGSEKALNMLQKDLGRDVFDDPLHTSCTGIGYHSDIVPLDTIMTVVARQSR